MVSYLCGVIECGLEKSVPQDNRLSSLGKPRDAKQWSSGQIFLSHPHTHDSIVFYRFDGYKRFNSTRFILDLFSMTL